MLALLPSRNAPETLGLRGQQEATEEQSHSWHHLIAQDGRMGEDPGEQIYRDLFNTLLCFLLQQPVRGRLRGREHAEKQLTASYACCYHPGRQFSIPTSQRAVPEQLSRANARLLLCTVKAKTRLLAARALSSSNSQHRGSGVKSLAAGS